VLTLNNLTIANGNANDAASGGAGHGGGVLNSGGYLDVTNCTFTGNQSSGGGGAIGANGRTSVSTSTFTANSSLGPGGAIEVTVNSIFAVSDSSFVFNISNLRGGAIYVVTYDPFFKYTNIVQSSTFSDNRALGLGGAISNQSVAGALWVLNSTFTGNKTARFGAAIDTFAAAGGSTMWIAYSTFFNNNSGAGQISSRGNEVVQLQNTIIANPLPEPTINCYQPYNSTNFLDAGGNVRWPTADSTCIGSYGDPKLGPLAKNGGPTETMSLALGSAAIDAGIKIGIFADQRGVFRSNPPDAGAFESTYDNP
jgi:predicted outer membrane repeat protein